MIVYRVFYKNYELKKGQPLGELIERRKDLRGKSPIESGLRWARLTFGKTVKDKHAIFVVPHGLHLVRWPMEEKHMGKTERERLPTPSV